MPSQVVVLDANILYGIETTDLVLTMATRRLFRPHWSPQILEEVSRNLYLRHDLDQVAIDRRLGHMNRALPSALFEPAGSVIERMPINDKDRHVLALAVQVDAEVIVTENLRDFPSNELAEYGVSATSLDVFVLGYVQANPREVLSVIDSMAARRRHRPKTRQEIIEVLRRYLTRSMSELSG